VTATGALTATDRDIAIQAQGGDVTLAGASAGADIAVRATGSVTATSLDAGSVVGGPGAPATTLVATNPVTSFDGSVSYTLSGNDVDVKAGASIGIGSVGATTTPYDARLQAGTSATVGSVAATDDVMIDAGTTVTATGGVIATNDDIAVRAQAGSVSLTSASAGDDLVVRAIGATSDVTASGALVSGTHGDGPVTGVGDLLFKSDPLTAFGYTYLGVTGSEVIDLVAGGSITLSGPATAMGVNTAPARFVSLTGSVTTAAVTAGQDVVIDAATSAAATGALTATKDIAVRAQAGNVTLTAATAANDVVLRASGAVSATSLDAGFGSGGAGQAATVLAASSPVTPFSGTTGYTLSGEDVDVKAGTSIGIGGVGATDTPYDARLQAGTSVTVGGVAATDDVMIDAGTTVTATGALVATNDDVAVRAQAGR